MKSKQYESCRRYDLTSTRGNFSIHCREIKIAEDSDQRHLRICEAVLGGRDAFDCGWVTWFAHWWSTCLSTLLVQHVFLKILKGGLLHCIRQSRIISAVFPVFRVPN